VVTLLTPLPFEDELEDDEVPLVWSLAEPVDPLDPVDPPELVDPLDPEPVVVAVWSEATVVPDDAVEVWLASAGSWPETRTIAIISQAATNSATAPEITRRRIVRTRAARALRSACPRARASVASLSVMYRCTSCLGGGGSKRVISFVAPRISRVRPD
jgi:hypothetical protein